MATATAARDPKRSDGGPIKQYKCGVDILYGGCIGVIDNTSSGYLLDGDGTCFEITGLLMYCEGAWKLASKGSWDDDVIRTLQAKADRERKLTAVR